VTGCFQEASGMNNFVLTNLTESGSSPEQRAKGYRIEQGGEIDGHVGKQVRITGWTEPNDTAATSGTASAGQTGSAGPAANRAKDEVSFKDFPELHVENIENVGQNCGTSGGSSRGTTSRGSGK